MNSFRLFLAILTFLPQVRQPPASAQTRATVIVTVRSARGDSVANATIHATASRVDTTLLLNSRGEAVFRLPSGTAHLQVKSIGYDPVDRDIAVGITEQRVEIVMTANAQQLAQREIRAKWIGVRGTVGDNNTKRPVSDAVITTSRNKVRIVTDSAGKFEVPVERGETVVLQMTHSGYKTKVIGIDLHDGASDVVILLTPGKDAMYMKTAMAELHRRTALDPFQSFVATRNELEKNGGVNVRDALESSGLLQRNGLILGDTICLFVDGLPRPYFPISTVVVKNIEFIEVYGGRGGDITGTLKSEWPPKTPCTKDATQYVSPSEKRPAVSAVSVWTRK